MQIEAMNNSTKAIAYLMSQAFWNDPAPHVAQLWQNTPKEKVLPRYAQVFNLSLNQAGKHLLTAQEDANTLGALSYCLTQDLNISLWAQVRATIPFLLATRGAFRGFLAFQALLDKYIPKDEGIYLSALATKSEAQGRGIGSQLMRHFLEYHVNNGQTVYLETGKNRNVQFYESLGFKTYQNTHFRRAPIWFMSLNKA